MKFRDNLLTSAALLFCTASISAQQNHTWVSRSGSDANSCTSDAPCRTFQGALLNTVSGGMITALDAGDFGAVTINQSVTIDGNNLGSITFNNTTLYDTGITIIAGANVTLQNLTINGLGSGVNGIWVVYGGIITVHNCDIMNVAGQGTGILFGGAGNLTVENSRIETFNGINNTGIFLHGNATENLVVKNTVIDVSPYSNENTGFNIVKNSGPVTATLQNVTIMGAGNAAVDVSSGVTVITGSVITQSLYGVYASAGATVSVASSLITSNTEGVCSNAGSKIRLDNNDIYDNPTAIGNCGGIIKTSTTNKTSGTISLPAADVSESVTF